MAIRSKGKEKIGGVRVVFFVGVNNEELLLMSIYDKSERESISNEELKERLGKYQR